MLLSVLSAGAAADDDKLRPGEFIPLKPPQPAPEVSFTDIAGHAVTLGEFEGKPAIVNLWATWCQPCLKEMPSLERLQAKFFGKINVAAVSEDHGGATAVAPFVAKLQLREIKIYLDSKGAMEHALAVRGLPTSFVLDAKGRVVGKVEGAAEWDSDKMIAVIQPLLDGNAAPLTHARAGPFKPPGG